MIFNGYALAPCVFFKPFTCWWNMTTRSSSTAILLSLSHSVCIAIYDWPDVLYTCLVMHRELWFAESWHVTALWCHDHNGKHQNMRGVLVNSSRATCHVYGRKFDIKMECKRDQAWEFSGFFRIYGFFRAQKILKSIQIIQSFHILNKNVVKIVPCS